ncbi:MAG: hypothetical protein ACJASX_003720 [Limisphaerales bacterium]|jgi:hypothetical protein
MKETCENTDTDSEDPVHERITPSGNILGKGYRDRLTACQSSHSATPLSAMIGSSSKGQYSKPT